MAQPAPPRFDIQRFDVSGNTLIPAARLQALLGPYTGKQRDFGHIQRALEALEAAYRADGYGTVRVELPEQEATSGIVRFNVTEVKLANIQVQGNQHYGEANVLRALPALKRGETPNLRRMSENVQLSNESLSKKVEVVFAAGQALGTIDAKVSVEDESPHRFSVSADNTGSTSSGHLRTGFYYQHENLFDRDHAASLAYTTSPDSPSGVRVNIFGLGYRLPLYALGDSLDFLYGYSSSTTPSSTPSLAGALNLVGRGEVVGLHYNHNFPRAGETTSRLTAGIDYTHTDTRCTTVSGAPVSVASCEPYTVTPVKLGYASTTASAGLQTDYRVEFAQNLPSGARYTNLSGRTDRYSYLTPGNRDTRDGFTFLRAGASVVRALPQGWQLRLAVAGQYTQDPLVSAVSFGLVGANAVRGFGERVLSSDSGVVANGELYTPEATIPDSWKGTLRGLVFVDAGHGSNEGPHTVVAGNTSPSSFGIGLRANFGKRVSLRLDVASVLDTGGAADVSRGDVKAHAFLSLAL
ncbi:MAG: ShlB/FhaC/HecB family hemolysin secretion/activation protein [Rhizobacter sp.]